MKGIALFGSWSQRTGKVLPGPGLILAQPYHKIVWVGRNLSSPSPLQ